MANVSIAEQFFKEAADLEAQGKLVDAKNLKQAAKKYTFKAVDLAAEMSLDSNTKTVDFLPLIGYLESHANTYFPEDIATPNSPASLFFQGMYAAVESSGMIKHYREIELEAEDAAEAANMAELANEISKIQASIDDLQNVAKEIMGQGATAEEAAAYIADQEAQMRAGMAELCAAGDSNAC